MTRTQGTAPRQAYNAQAAANDRQIMLAAEVTVSAADFGHLGPMLDTSLSGLERHGITERPQVVLADAGYWHTAPVQAMPSAGSRCSPRLTATCARANVRAGTTGFMS